MKALYVYNSHSSEELSLIERVKLEMKSYITVKSYEECSEEVKSLVRSTPALIIASDELQGEQLMKEDVDGQLLVTASLFKRLDEEVQAIHNQGSCRLDSMIKFENNKAKDAQMLELITGGII